MNPERSGGLLGVHGKVDPGTRAKISKLLKVGQRSPCFKGSIDRIQSEQPRGFWSQNKTATLPSIKNISKGTFI